MKPSDIRNMAWADIQARLEGDREKVYWALSGNGPCTTEVLALKMEWSVLSVRPRVTELFQLGLVELYGKQGHEGIYKAVALDLARARHETIQHGNTEQLLMGVHG